MTDTLSYKFIRALEDPRDRLYTLALARESSPAKAEAFFQKSIRTLFPRYAGDPSLDVAGELEKCFASASPPPASPAPPAPPVPAPVQPMPADVWARLAAAVQVEAAKSNSSLAINPDSVLLSPDPLLAPKKPGAADDIEGLGLSPPSRFMLGAAIAVFIGIILTIYILTRPTPVQPRSTTLPGARAVSP